MTYRRAIASRKFRIALLGHVHVRTEKILGLSPDPVPVEARARDAKLTTEPEEIRSRVYYDETVKFEFISVL